jgi:hypothetical protein
MHSNVVFAVRLLAVGVLLMVAQPRGAGAEEPPYALFNEWWQWALSMPSAINPILDNSGKSCSIGQRGNLWLLAGNTGGRTVRECTLPAGTRALIPVHNTFCASDGQFTEQQCLDAVVADWNSFTFVEATLDGVPQVLIDQPAVPGESAFTFTVPRNGIFGLRSGLYRATLSAGRWAIVDLGPPGIHTLRARTSSTTGFKADVTYRLSVAEVH